jgi:mono/diheme cytochrome c family protein
VRWGPVAFALSISPVVVACGPGAHSRAAGVVGQVAVAPVVWNASNAPMGHVRAVADAGDVVAVFSDTGATVLASKAVVSTDTSVNDWVDAGAVSATDGSGQWIVGARGNGHLYRLRNQSTFEDVSGRYGLGAFAARGATSLGPGFTGFLLDGEIAIADGHQVARYGSAKMTDFAGGGGFAVGVAHDSLYVVNAAQKTATTFALPDVTHAALGPSGRVYATTSRAVYAANDKGELALVYESDDDTIHGLVASGPHVWFADGSELGVVDGDNVAETTGVHVAVDAKLAASASGDVWVVGAGGLQRFARADSGPSPTAMWTATLSPIFARACASCHMPNGVSGTDLSTPAAWQSERPRIRERVVVTKTMPPQGHPISDADRAAIQAWTANGQQ